ncbi:hypothetical protein OK016_00175 [Vibrio chagasii]|nr:hypothetical protein [Vibrio chagasii]
MVQRSLSLMARLQEPMTVPVRMMHTWRRYGFRDYHRCNGRQLRELAKDPTAATTTINDDSDVTTVSLWMRQSPKARTSPTRRHCNESRGMARVDGDAKQWCNDHYRRWRDFRNHDGSAQVMMYT